ncbi:MAG: hypothetical protein HQK83_02175 [Fibrobacteria bacterium]|nr:hypothetical protein [Fibrobacteria bacterium]
MPDFGKICTFRVVFTGIWGIVYFHNTFALRIGREHASPGLKKVSVAWFISLFLWLSVIPLSASTKDCKEDPEFYKFLSGTIGDGKADKPSVYLFPCDTMFIAENVSVMINKNTYLAFADPQPANAIIVKGSLVMQGTQEERVQLSSAVDTLLLSPEEMKKPWWGIVLERTGSLYMNNTIVHGTSVPIQVNSNHLKIVNSFFLGGDILLIEGLVNYKIPKVGFVEDFSMDEYIRKLAHPDETAQNGGDKESVPTKKRKRKKSILKSPWPYVGLSLVTAGFTGYLFYNWFTEEDGETISEGTVNLDVLVDTQQ